MREFLGGTVRTVGYVGTAATGLGASLFTWDRAKEAQNGWMDWLMENSGEGVQDFFGIAYALLLAVSAGAVAVGVTGIATHYTAKAIDGKE